MREIGAVGVAALATVALLVALSAVVEARAGIATALLAAAVALFVTLPVQRRRRRAAPPLEATDAAQLPEAITEALGLSFAAVELRVGNGFERIAASGLEPPATVTLDVRSGGAVVGRLRVPESGERAAREIAAHAGPVLQAARASRTLAGDLHDRVGPALAGLKLSVAARRRGAAVPDLAHLAEETATEVRHVLAGLAPATMQERGLIASIELLAGRLAPEGRPVITVRSPADLPPLDREAEQAAYAIAVEALTNAVKHANANHIAVELRDDLTLVISDDGEGFAAGAQEGVGLPSMRRRAPVQITNDEHGTRVEAQISRLFRDKSP